MHAILITTNIWQHCPDRTLKQRVGCSLLVVADESGRFVAVSSHVCTKKEKPELLFFQRRRPGWISTTPGLERIKTCKTCTVLRKNLHFIWKWRNYILIHLFHFLYFYSRVSCSKMFTCDKLFLSSKLFMFLYVLVEMKFASDTFLHHRPWFKNSAGVMELMLHSHFVFVILWHGLGRRAEE